MDKKTSNLKYLAVGYPANAALPAEVVQLFEQLGDKINGLGEDCVAKFNAVAKLAESLECVGAMVYDTAGAASPKPVAMRTDLASITGEVINNSTVPVRYLMLRDKKNPKFDAYINFNLKDTFFELRPAILQYVQDAGFSFADAAHKFEQLRKQALRKM